MRNKRIAKILGIGLSIGMVVALLGAIFVAPAAADQMKWTTTNTPDWGDLVIHVVLEVAMNRESIIKGMIPATAPFHYGIDDVTVAPDVVVKDVATGCDY